MTYFFMIFYEIFFKKHYFVSLMKFEEIFIRRMFTIDLWRVVKKEVIFRGHFWGYFWSFLMIFGQITGELLNSLLRLMVQ